MDNDNGLEGEFILNQPNRSPDPRTASPSKTTTPDTKPEQSTANPFTSYRLRPKNMSFANQDADEEIILLLRRHFITNLPWILATVLLLFFPIVFVYILAPTFSIFSISESTGTALLAFYYIALFGYIVLRYALWYFHLGLITNKKIVDIDMTSILSKNIAETTLEAIEDVSYNQKGFLRTFFDFGDVFVQTRATESNFEFDAVPHPSKVVQIINKLAHKSNE